MVEFVVKEVLEAAGGALKGGRSAHKFTSVSTDTRTLRPGALFIPLKGPRQDGHSFIPKAIQKGAEGILFSQNIKIPGKIASIKVRDTVRALGKLASYHRRRFNLAVVGVTGSNGKTTTKEMLAGILSHRFKTLKSKRSFNNFIGVPLTLLGINSAHSAAVIEMGMSAPGEISYLADLAMPSVGIVTNVGSAHLEYFSGISRIADAKGELLSALEQDAAAVLNKDSDFFSRLKKKVRCKLITFGFNSNADFYPEDVRGLPGGTTFKLFGRRIRLNIPGRHNVYNALSAAAAAATLGVGNKAIKEGLEGFVPPPMRMEIMRKGNITIVNDAYNANPESMKEALVYLDSLRRKKKVCIVIGDMLEMGKSSHRRHFEIGFLAGGVGDIVVSVGRFAEDVARGAGKAGLGSDVVFACRDVEAAITPIKKMGRSPLLVLVKGSRAMRMERILKYL